MFVRTFAEDVSFSSLDRDWLTDPWDRAQDDWRHLMDGLGPMVRAFYGKDRSDVREVELAEVKLDAGGYAQNGHYFGRDSRRLFEVEVPVPVTSGMPGYCRYFYVRARTIPGLKGALKRLFPNARIVRV